MALPLPRPGLALQLGRSALGTAVEAAAALATVPVRLARLLAATELLVTRMTVTAEKAERLIERTAGVVGDAEDAVRQARVIAAAAALAVQEASEVAAGATAVLGKTEQVAEAAGVTVTAVAATAGTADELLTEYEPTLRRAAPMAQRFVEQLSPEELSAAIRLVDELPRLREHLTGNVLPILGTLDRVGPDVHDLLEVTRDLRLAVAGIPGLGMLRRRGEDRLAAEQPTD